MSRPYLVGWGYALKAFFKSYRKSKIQRKFWRQLIKKKYYWLTTEERIESNKKHCAINKDVVFKYNDDDLFCDDYYDYH